MANRDVGAARPQQHGRPDPRGAQDKASLIGRITFSWSGPIIAKGWEGALDEDDALFLVPDRDMAQQLSSQFNEVYERKKAKGATRGLLNTTTRALIALYWGRLIYHAFWVIIEVGVRLTSPVALRGFLHYLQVDSLTPGSPDWPGWLWALFVASMGLAMTIIHHQFFWVGMRMGFTMRQQVVAAIHQKVLRLNSASVVHANTGHIVNLASNDVRRFDDAMPFWLFSWAAPLETAMVLLMVSLELGFVPAICGVGACLSVMPMQSLLVRTVGSLRRNTAMKTDERVRLTGEVIQGALAMKMLGWEDPFADAIRKIRSQEVKYAGRMAQIRGMNMALQFSMTTVAAFTTFAVYYALGGTLELPKVFYVLSLLQLPRLYQVYFFVLSIQYLTELKISLQRIDDFLSLKEPPPPVFQQTAAQAAAGGSTDSSAAAAAVKEGGDSSATAAAAAAAAGVPVGTVQLRGADYDWAKNLQMAAGEEEGTASGSSPAQPSQAALSEAAAGGAVPVVPAGPTLKGLQLEVSPGELLGVAGEVGSGKSSLLAALLGELLPSTGGAEGTGPLVVGRVAYCSQVPWIMAGSVRENILFGSPLDPGRYHAVVEAAALGPDLAELPAGDDTELGERGINLSGGQKARVALARAAYSGADVQLLDDPLSAVDPRVGRILFDRCIGTRGVMAGSTRVLVTHQRQYLPRCDRVAVLRGGRLVACGTWEQLADLQLPELVAGAAVMEHFEDEEEEQQQPPSSNSSEGANTPPSSTATAATTPTAVAPDAVAVALPAHNGLADLAAQTASNTRTHKVTAVAAAAAPGAGTGRPLGDSHPAPVSSKHDDVSDWAVEEGKGGSDLQLQLPRVRTMPPDVNRRPADSGRPVASNGYLAPGQQQQQQQRSFLGSMQRAISRVWSSAVLPGQLRGKSASAAAGGEQPPSASSTTVDATGQLVKAERRELGGVDWKVYFQYALKIGLPTSTILSISLLAGQACSTAADWWLAMWAAAPLAQQSQPRWLSVYGVLAALVVVVAVLRAVLFFYGTLRAATHMHNSMVGRVLRAPLSFFHTNPAGRILNRFSNDQGRVDDLLPMAMFDVLQTGFQCLAAFTLVSIAVPFILPVFVPLLVAFYLLRTRYITTSREVKRWEAITRSPVYASLSATLKGLPTIRAYHAEERFHAAFLSAMSLNGSWWYAFIATARWIGFRLDVLASTTLAVGVLLAMAIHHRVSAAVLALALTYVLQLTGTLQWWVRQTAEVENTMTSVERLLEYTVLPQEPPRLAEGGGHPPEGWPRSGALVYQAVTASYRPGLPPVLRGLSFSLPGGCSCGVVGRTGSGKSSLMLTLFRLIDINGGSIFLDGVDTSSIGLDALRSQLAIIPQDPVLFSGSLRSNLDPWGTHPDAALWEVLGKVQLRAAITAAGGLAAPMAECGDNLSVGQRQLFCLARALLARAKVLALDEATANVDRATDALIQSALREFAHGSSQEGRVLLVIAHRIDTILDCDQLLVLSNGLLAEEGSPAQLMATQGGMFAGMVEAAKAAAAGVAAGDAAPTEGPGPQQQQ